MNISRIITVMALSMFMTVTAKATPARPNECKIFRPSVIRQYIYKKSDLDEVISSNNNYGQKGENTRAYWQVYSDRSNNICYEDSKGDAQCPSTLDFGEEVIIAQIENDRALVYQDKGMVKFPQISSGAVMKGWVPLDRLLLWSCCPTNDRYIYHKALIVANMDQIKDDKYFSYYFTNPGTKDGKKSLRSDMNFYFVMKTDKETGMVLLAKESVVGGKINTFYGWVSPGTYIEWDDRTCLELTWDINARQQLQASNNTVIPVRDIKTEAIVTNVVMNEKNKVSSGTPQDIWRMDPHILRFPLLSVRKNEFEATIFAKEGQTNMKEISKGVQAKVELERTIENMRIVNIIVVIDGTKGMENSFKYVQRAVEQVNKEFFLKLNREVRVGGVIYRDYGYKNGSNNCEYEVYPMMSINDPRLKEFFSGGKYGINNAPTDKEDFEALYLGLSKALDPKIMNYNKENNNLMFVIGDCGNRPNDAQSPKHEELVEKCVNNRIQLSAFQVRNLGTPESNWFHRQMSDIVLQNMKRQYEKVKGTKGIFKDAPDGYGYDFVPQNDNSRKIFIGCVRRPKLNTDMDESRLYSLLKSAAEKFDVAMEEKVETLDNAPDIINNESSDAMTSFDRDFLLDFLGPQTYNLLKQNQYYMAKKGLVPQKSNNGVKYWDYVLYISSREFKKLMQGLGQVYNGIDRESPNLRKDYVDAMKGLVQAMLPGYTDSQVNNLSNTQIMDQISGLNYRTSTMMSHSLTDILDEKVVNNNEFNALTSDFISKYRNLQRITEQKYPFMTQRGNEKYYWIPADLLP